MNQKTINPKTVFLTGGTGLVGSYLLKILLKQGHKVFALATDNGDRGAYDRIRDAICFWDKRVFDENKHNLIVVNGDIFKKKCGLKADDLEILEKETEVIYHCAATTKFNAPLKESREINVQGTENIIKLGLKCQEGGALKKINYISTAFVCGDHKGRFSEKDLDLGQKFVNSYTQSKFEAEKLVQKYQKDIWIDIFRLPLVLGERDTGRTFSFSQALYQLLHMWDKEIFEYFPIKGLGARIAFVDEVCESILILDSGEIEKNKTYHVFNGRDIRVEDFFRLSQGYLNIANLNIVTEKEFLMKNTSSVKRRLLENNILAYNPNVNFDSKWTNKLLARYGVSFTPAGEKEILKLLKYCKEINFIKKRK